jgi:hypothetical protein
MAKRKTVNIHLKNYGLILHMPLRDYRRLMARYQREVLRRKPLLHNGGKPR